MLLCFIVVQIFGANMDKKTQDFKEGGAVMPNTEIETSYSTESRLTSFKKWLLTHVLLLHCAKLGHSLIRCQLSFYTSSPFRQVLKDF